jgi:chemotaxis protein histidine kinase CheA
MRGAEVGKTRAELSRELSGLRRTFLAQLPDRVQAIETTLNGALSAREIDREGIDGLRHLAHRLCGSAGIYGCATVHAVAGAVERAAEDLLDAGEPAQHRRLAEVRQLVVALRCASREAVPGPAEVMERSVGT